RIIWYAVRAHRLNGPSFRRQDPIGPFIVDFVCHHARLIVELDGGQHFETEHEKRDAQRDAFLTARGYRVLRFSNHEVMTNRAGVLEAVNAALVASPSPPSPASGGGGPGSAQAADTQTNSAQTASPSPHSPASGGGRSDSEPAR